MVFTSGSKTFLAYSSHDTESIQVNAAKFLQEIRRVQSLKFFKVELAAGSAKRRRMRMLPAAVAELKLCAGMDAEEDMMTVIGASMQREV